MTSFAAVNIHLSYRNEQVLALSILIVDIKRLSIRPLKWLRYVAFTVFGTIGHLALTADGSAVEDENITWESQDRLCEDYYYIPDVQQNHASRNFRQSIIQRDGDSCVFTGEELSVCEAIHLLPKSKGDEYIQIVHQDRRHAYSRLPSPILEFESPILESMNCVENGVLVRSDLHKKYVHGAIAFLKTPNFALNPEDIPRVEEGDVPTSHITLQHIQPPQGRYPVAQHDARITDSGNPPVSTIILDYVYGVAALKRWSRGPDVEKMMRERFEAVYESIPPRPRPSPEFSDDDILDDDSNDDEPQRSGTRRKHRKRHTHQMSDSMLRAMDTVLALSMYVKGNTLESLAAELTLSARMPTHLNINKRICIPSTAVLRIFLMTWPLRLRLISLTFDLPSPSLCWRQPPDDKMVNDMLANYDEYLARMSVSQEDHFVNAYESVVMSIDNVPDTVNPVRSSLTYIQVPNKKGDSTDLNLAWRFEVEMQDNWYDAAVSATSPHRIISVVDWVSDAPIPTPEPTTSSVGVRMILRKADTPSSKKTSTFWHPPKQFWRNTTTTWGNNVFAQENWEGQNSFIDNYDFLPLTRVFRYGFDEVSGNFQQHNFGRGGEENDAVIANAQDGSGYNNANFMTPPDGRNGRMRMYLWNTALPYRDGDMEAGIVIHELSHGLSTRLTGGPASSSCLGWGESGGMGEGWGDFLATTIRSTSKYSDFPMGAWAANREQGIRNYPYSLNDTMNPSTYQTLDKPGHWSVHAIGEVWAQILWVVEQRLIAVHGFSEDLFPPAPLADGTVPEGKFYRPRASKKPLVPKHGNSLIVQLVINRIKLQLCLPGFFEARGAIIQAMNSAGGENF
ncbi:Fungalysin metallopeptidase-domain-containing protein [Armillaria luteobubalina]|uniref:Extracellular metalloproteinase n=1 Tax=Armillaria luteobubalina TaxID=153913 RepID=A0AA39QH61_9AGAR|nr:Fungalysin metallopeptidase-domain-containing protein [Armillaria luteobubalina]